MKVTFTTKAKQFTFNVLNQKLQGGLPRRYAPRNDGFAVFLKTLVKSLFYKQIFKIIS
jgi:hypothetical protein